MFKEIETFYALNPTSGTQIDLRGAALAKQDMTDAANVVLNAYGVPTGMYMDLLTKGDLDTLYLSNARYETPNPQGITGGISQTNHVFQAGQMFSFIPDVFLRPGGIPPISAAPSSPVAPTFTSLAAANAASALAATTYKYQVTSLNMFGESLASAAATVAATVGQMITLTITIAAPNSFDAVAFKIYRADTATGNPVYIKTIPAASPTTGTFVDLNADLPGTSKALLMMEDPTNYVIKQLSPFTKIPLATIDASIRWMQLLYATPICFTPGKNVYLKNIGRRAGSLV